MLAVCYEGDAIEKSHGIPLCSWRTQGAQLSQPACRLTRLSLKLILLLRGIDARAVQPPERF
jgi:hypothetical protein